MSHGSGARRLRLPAVVMALTLGLCLVAGCAAGPDKPLPDEPGPAAGTATAAASGGLRGKTDVNGYHLPMRYTAADGDTWEGIASYFRMTPEILKSFNEPAPVAAGREIDLRGVSVPQLGAGGHATGLDGEGRLLYRAAPGDTPAGIASRYGVPLYALRLANLDLLTGGEWIPPAGTTVTIPKAPAG